MQVETNKLLIVDDEQVVCNSCVRILKQHGFSVEFVTDPITGIGLAATNNYAAILLDLKMPKIDGFRFLQALHDKKINIPVIVITGYPSVRHATLAKQLGAIAFVTKPFTPREILTAVVGILPQPHSFVDLVYPESIGDID